MVKYIHTIIFKKMVDTHSQIIYKIYFENNYNKQCIIKFNKINNNIYILSYLCNSNICSQLDMYTLLNSIIILLNPYNINNNTLIYYKNKNMDYYNLNMLLLLKFKLYINSIKFRSREIKRLQKNLIHNVNDSYIFKSKFIDLKNNLKIFSNYNNQNKLYKYIYK